MVVVLLREEEYNKNPIYMKLDFVNNGLHSFL